MQMIRKLTLTLAVLGAMLLSPFATAEADVIRLRDGRVLEGQVVRETDEVVFFRYNIAGIEQQGIFTRAEIESLERDAMLEDDEVRAAADSPQRSATPGDGTPRLAIITMEGTVGMYMTAKTIHDAIPLLKEEGVTDVVLRINSGGGSGWEVKRLTDVIHNELKKEFRVVAWIESAISAAAMTAHCLSEVYFLPEGNYGACTGFRGALVAVKGRELEDWIYEMEKISAWGGHDPAIMRSMQHSRYPLSVSIDPRTGEVNWYQDETGDDVLNPEGQILTFNSLQAQKYRFSRGTAETLDELARLMGYEEVVWVGEEVDDVPWPVSKAEELQMDYREQMAEDERRMNEYFMVYELAVEMARGANGGNKGKFVNRAREALGQIHRAVTTNTSLQDRWGPGDAYERWYREQLRILRDL